MSTNEKLQQKMEKLERTVRKLKQQLEKVQGRMEDIVEIIYSINTPSKPKKTRLHQRTTRAIKILSAKKKDDPTSLQEYMESIATLVKYLVFDVEASHREITHLKRLLEKER